ncbi:DNA-binding NarL/FixJ family response regulator [Kitasatospora gansuensis]|uniref:DNA-binding NarL/FixJ family response regulator n=1 Tax=Kitasatospora gansuensis TaxID=258050 RepID=A0A7W7WIL0_9ACTN|nr:DNA-binding NarL/FixJ family response regulator [Kitasatospora gansuensis]
MTPIRVLIVDDQPLVRRGLALILSPDPSFEVVGEAENGAQAVSLARQLRPDVAVMDIRMPVLDGVAATGELATAVPDCRVLALSTFDMDEYVWAPCAPEPTDSCPRTAPRRTWRRRSAPCTPARPSSRRACSPG